MFGTAPTADVSLALMKTREYLWWIGKDALTPCTHLYRQNKSLNKKCMAKMCSCQVQTGSLLTSPSCYHGGGGLCHKIQPNNTRIHLNSKNSRIEKWPESQQKTFLADTNYYWLLLSMKRHKRNYTTATFWPLINWLTKKWEMQIFS
jgi:hypothetical protein